MSVLENAVESQSTENLLEMFEEYQTWVNTQVVDEEAELRLFAESVLKSSSLSALLAVSLEVSAQLVKRAYQ